MNWQRAGKRRSSDVMSALKLDMMAIYQNFFNSEVLSVSFGSNPFVNDAFTDYSNQAFSRSVGLKDQFRLVPILGCPMVVH